MVLEYSPYHRSLFEDLYQRQILDGYIGDIEEIEQQARHGSINKDNWKEKWSSKDDISWLSASPSLKGINLRDYFWIARDSIKDAVPVEDIVTRPVLFLFNRLMKLMTGKQLKSCINDELGAEKYNDDEKGMLVLLLNRNVRKNPADEQTWRILNADENNRIIGCDINKLSTFFEGVASEEIPPSASTFYKRMTNIEGFQDFVSKLHISQRLTKALKL